MPHFHCPLHHYLEIVSCINVEEGPMCIAVLIAIIYYILGGRVMCLHFSIGCSALQIFVCRQFVVRSINVS